MNAILSGNVLWSFDFEVQARDSNFDIFFHVSFIKPFHVHEGEIFLTENSIKITGSDELEIPLKNLSQLYLGFDEIYKASLSKNFGLFWQPLRLTLSDGKRIYLIIDFDSIGAKTQLWFNTLQEILS